MQKHKILFVVGALHRAGAERFAYEIDFALNKDKFDISILCLENQINHNVKWNERYYEKKHMELGTTIEYLDGFLENNTNGIMRRVFHKITKKKFKKNKGKWNPKFYSYLNTYDVVHWIGEYTFIHTAPEYIKKKSLIHIMTAKFQDSTIYNNFNHKDSYHFISGFKEDEKKHEFNQFNKVEHTYFPLVLNIVQKENKWKYTNSTVKKIGIFTRLDRYKPLDPFLYSFQLLLDKMPNCELHIFGNGDPVREGVTNILERLAITDKVFFRGHQEDIVKTLNIEHIDLSWFQGYNNDRPAGYAGFDVCTTGTPLICWDFFPEPNSPFNSVYPHFKNLNEFVSESFKVLTNKEAAEKLSHAQFNDIEQSRNSKYFIQILERAYQNIATQ